jgi:hypothetical protein
MTCPYCILFRTTVALLPNGTAPHRTHGRAAAGPRESAKPHRSRIVSSSSKSPSPFPSSQVSKITRPYGRSNSSTLVYRSALACGRCVADKDSAHAPSWAGLFRSHQSPTREGERPSVAAETLLPVCGWRLFWSWIDIWCVLETLICLTRVRLAGKAAMIDNDNNYPMRNFHPAVRLSALKQSKVEGIRFELPFVDLFASHESIVNTAGLLFT